MLEGEEYDVFKHPAMILKNRDINDLYKAAVEIDAFNGISLQSFKKLKPYYIAENEPKFQQDCYCVSCGNGLSACQYLKKCGQLIDDEVLMSMDITDWHLNLLCSNTESINERLICLRSKRKSKKCFLHKKKSNSCAGNYDSVIDLICSQKSCRLIANICRQHFSTTFVVNICRQHLSSSFVDNICRQLLSPIFLKPHLYSYI